MSKKLLIIIVGVVVLLGGGGAAFFLMGGKEEPAAEEEAAAVQEPPGVVSLDSFLVNLTDVDTDRFARVHVKITVQPALLAEEIQRNELLGARLRDRTLGLLASKSYGELTTTVGRENLRDELKVILGPVLSDDGGQVEDVLFTEFMVQ